MDGMTVGQVARALGKKRGHIDYLLRTGRMDYVRFGPLRVVTSLAIRPAKRKVGRPREVKT